jgi:hypothetical protein
MAILSQTLPIADDGFKFERPDSPSADFAPALGLGFINVDCLHCSNTESACSNLRLR